jgi:zinc protease
MMWATARPGVELKQVEQVVTDEIARLAKKVRLRRNSTARKPNGNLISFQGWNASAVFGGKSDLLNSYNTFFGEPGKFEEDLARHRGVTAESLRATVEKY